MKNYVTRPKNQMKMERNLKFKQNLKNINKNLFLINILKWIGTPLNHIQALNRMKGDDLIGYRPTTLPPFNDAVILTPPLFRNSSSPSNLSNSP